MLGESPYIFIFGSILYRDVLVLLYITYFRNPEAFTIYYYIILLFIYFIIRIPIKPSLLYCILPTTAAFTHLSLTTVPNKLHFNHRNTG